MTFKNLNKYRGCRYQRLMIIILLVVVKPIYADVTINNPENNDKVSSKVIPAKNELLQQPSDIKSQAWELQAEQWEFARGGENILSLPVLNNLITSWLADRQKLIEIKYPGGEEGEFWVQELTDWLVSLGIPSDRMIIVAGSGAGDMIKFDLIKQ